MSRMKIKAFIILLIVLNTNTLQSSGSFDSLKRLIESNKGDARRLGELYLELASRIHENNPDSAIVLLQKGLYYSKQSGYKEAILKNCYQLGVIFLKKDSLSKAHACFEQARKLITESTEVEMQEKILNGLGYIYDLRSDNANALKMYMKGLNLAEKTANRYWESSFLNNIAVIYNRSGNNRKALNFYTKASAIFEELHDSVYYANSLINIGVTYKIFKKTDSALYYFNQALPLELKQNNHYGLTNLYNNLGDIQLESGKADEALTLYWKSLESLNNLGPEYWGSRLYLLAETEYNLGNAYLRLNDYRKAMYYFEKVKHNAGRTSVLSYETQAILGISEVFSKMGKADSALKYSKLYIEYRDSLTRLENIQKTSVLDFELNFQKEKEQEKIEKERQDIQKKRKELNYIILIVGFLTISIILLLLFLLQRGKIHRINLVRKNLQLEKSNLEKDLDLKNKELASKVMSLIEKTELVTEISHRIKSILKEPEFKDSRSLREILFELQSKQGEGFWEEFNAHFKEIHSDFYTRLNARYKNLSPNEIKLCAFLKLNLSSKEISQITRKNPQTIKIARYRLRQKLGLSREENLTMFLTKY